MDLDAFVAAHAGEWARLEGLARRRGRLTGEEADELVMLYQRVATQLSVLRSRAPDPALIARLSSMLARARGAVTGRQAPAWQEAARFFSVVFPVAVYRARWWAIGCAAGSVAVAVALAVWIATHPQVQATIASPAEVRQLVDHDFASYYSSQPADAFAAKIWTNNAWVAALCIAFGALAGLPVIWLLFQNAANVGVVGGLMAGSGKLGLFFGLILPHGLLELTAVFVAAGVGLRFGWSLVDPGERSRSEAFAAEGRTAVTVAMGLVGVLLVSGVIEAFVTPSSLPTWARIGIGVVAWSSFICYVRVLGRAAAHAGETGDLRDWERGDLLPALG